MQENNDRQRAGAASRDRKRTSRQSDLRRVALGACLALGALAAPATAAPVDARAVAPLAARGQVAAWGDNESGQLGQGDTAARPRATTVGPFGAGTVTAVAAGYLSSLALESDGTVWSWGHNDNADLGRPSGELCNEYRCGSRPGRVTGLPPIRAVSMGNSSSLALARDGTVWAWGDNRDGQLGNGTTNAAIAPVRVSGLSGVRAIAAGRGVSLALTGDGTVWAWGDNTFGQLGTGRTNNPASTSTPMEIPGFSGVVAIAMGESHCLALLADGTVAAWGSDNAGDMGTGDPTSYGIDAPGRVVGLTHVVSIAAGSDDSFAVKDDGSLWAWGENDYGELGIGTSDNAPGLRTPSNPTPRRVAGLGGATAVVAGLHHVLALTGDGTVWAWGGDDAGQLGAAATGTCATTDGSKPCSPSPQRVPGVAHAGGIAAANYHSLALLGAGSLGSSPTGPTTPSTPSTLTRAFVDPSHSYTVSYPTSWTRTSAKGADLFARSPGGNIVFVTQSASGSKPGPNRIRRDLPSFVASVGKVVGNPTYTTDKRAGTTLYVGLSAYRSPDGQVGVALVGEIYGHHRLCVALGLVRTVSTPAGKADVLMAANVLNSLTLR